MKRKALIAGNWKMHMTVLEGCRLAAEIVASCKDYTDREVLLAPPCTIISEVSHILAGSKIILSSHNVCWEEKGAFTGEISPTMLQDAGASCAIVGHSERRQVFFESDEVINKRLKGALAFGLMGILCIGETLEEREAGNTQAVLERQVRKGLADVPASQMKQVVLAYEPVWAIGTGVTASKEQVQETHAALRQLISEIYEKDIAEGLRILYGGSVKATNVDELMSQQDIDGALVGGAALDSISFARIINFE
ncbi:triose-phosphate isomerase [Desulfotalea psychrophila]|uniref:Triosephosphate isomerase n=1 Tax=Desulfotalea psychrophila (strain LSv54 / DSM 12343) TaxID=177439 RepID=Q6AS46_DESPS|nr:triose-phosphate isomerase [Desulfotalea psychrophila]CAG34829.1 probable triosephosphate isomerase [Desulfotalea psychrophila LSv54]